MKPSGSKAKDYLVLLQAVTELGKRQQPRPLAAPPNRTPSHLTGRCPIAVLTLDSLFTGVKQQNPRFGCPPRRRSFRVMMTFYA
jgi:hypothetical protein